MLTLTPKTTKTELITEITAERERFANWQHEQIARAKQLTAQRDEARARAAAAEHKVSVLETDVHNLLGALRVMADSAREVRIRRSSVRDADLALALPFRNTTE